MATDPTAHGTSMHRREHPTILLAASVAANPLWTSAALARLRTLWPGQIYGIGGDHHAVHLAGHGDVERLALRLLARDPEAIPELAIVTFAPRSLDSLRAAFPGVRIALVVVDVIDAHEPEAILDAVAEKLWTDAHAEETAW